MSSRAGGVLAQQRPAPRLGLRAVAVRTGAGLGVGALLVLTFLKLIDVRSVLQRLEHLSIPLALLSGAVFLAAWIVRALRWRLFLAGHSVAAARVIGIYYVAVFINWLLPVRGGELAKSLLLRRSNGIPVSDSLPTVTMDKALDLLPAVALVVLLPFAHLQLSRPLWVVLLSILALLVSGASVLVLAAWRRERTLGWLTRGLGRVVPGRARLHVEPFLVRFIDTLLALARRPRLLLAATGCTVFAVGLDSLFCFLAFRTVGGDVSFPVVLFGYTLYNLAYILPTPPGQVGSNEVMGLLVFSGLFGVSSSVVGAMFLFSHPWTAMLMASTGLACLSSLGLKLRSTLGLARSLPPLAEEPAA